MIGRLFLGRHAPLAEMQWRHIGAGSRDRPTEEATPIEVSQPEQRKQIRNNNSNLGYFPFLSSAGREREGEAWSKWRKWAITYSWVWYRADTSPYVMSPFTSRTLYPGVFRPRTFHPWSVGSYYPHNYQSAKKFCCAVTEAWSYEGSF
jgi:hypothetical protein